jgi:7-cyano-7-deazaguanine tRNA-ribosyltransferase
LERYKPQYSSTILFPEGGKPYSKFFYEKLKKIYKKNSSINVLIDSSFGPVPLELDEMYPCAQSVFPTILDNQTEEELSTMFKIFTGNKEIICWKGKETLDKIQSSNKQGLDLDVVRIGAVSNMQFGKNASDVLLNGKIRIVKSKKTGKIRNIYVNGIHILSMRAGDGMFTLKLHGAFLLHKGFKFPKLRVVVENDAVPFVKENKSVFAKFVKDCDSNLRPLDECLIVDSGDNLLGVGRCLLNKAEMLSFDYGVAVKTRERF